MKKLLEKVRRWLAGELSNTEIMAAMSRCQCRAISEFVGRACALYELACEHQAEGGQLVFRDADGTEEVLDIFQR